MQFEDIHLSDAQLYTLFRQYYKNGAYQEALNVLAQNPQLDLKAITADNLNELSERIYGMENVYYVEVEQYLANLLQSMQTDVNNLSNQNQYSATQQYYENNFVYYNDDVYFCIKEPPIGTDPTNTNYWLYLGLFGNKGKYGISNLTFVGPWNTNTFYTENQAVYVDKTFYWALQDNQGQDPSTQPSDYWGVLFVVKPQQILRSKEPTGLETNDFWFQSFGYIQSVSAGPSTSLTIDPVPNSNIKVTAYGYTNQEGSGEPSPDNIRQIKVGGVRLKKVVLDGSEDWFVSPISNPQNHRFSLQISDILKPPSTNDVFDGYSSQYKSVTAVDTWEETEGISVENALSIFDNIFKTSEIDAWKSYLSENPVTVWYPTVDVSGDLYTPIITQGADYHCECLPLNEPLCEGDYVTNDGVEYHKKKVIVLDGENYTFGQSGSPGVVFITITNPPLINFQTLICSHLSSDNSLTGDYVIQCSDNQYIHMKNINYPTPAEFKTWVTEQYNQGTPVTIVYEYVNPTIYTNPSTQFLANPNSSGTVTITGENTVSATYDQQRY